MKIKELFKFIDWKSTYPDITIVKNTTDLQSVKTFKYPYDSNYVEEMLKEFGDEIIEPTGVTFGTDMYDIDYIIIQVK